MSKQEFLNNFRVARNLFFHPRVETDSPTLDPHALAQKLARSAIWLTPHSVAGFDAADFPELGPDRQSELEAAVRDFLDVANRVPAKQVATPEEYGHAAAAFEKLLALLARYLATPGEGALVEKVLRNVEFPPWVVNWDYEFERDEEGEPAVWINLYVDGDAATPRDFARLASRLNHQLLQALPAAGVNRWPFVRVRTAVEHKSL